MNYAFGEFRVNQDTRQLENAAGGVHLSPKAFELLLALLAARPRALSKAELHDTIWPETFVSDANLAMLVAEIRDALGDAAKSPRFVRTVPRFGYAFHGDAQEVGSPVARTFQYWLVASFRQVPLLPGENIVGRDPAAQVWLDATGVSRQHARISVQDDGVTIEDLHSKNGTVLRGTRIDGLVRLTDGDDIRFGSLVVTFRAWVRDQPTDTVSGS